MASNPNDPSTTVRNKEGRVSPSRVRFASTVSVSEELGQHQSSASSSTLRQALDHIQPNRVSFAPQFRLHQQPRRRNPCLESSTQTESFKYPSPVQRNKTVLAIPSSLPDSPPNIASESPRKSLAFQSQQQLASSPETLLLTESLQRQEILPRKSLFSEQQRQEIPPRKSLFFEQQLQETPPRKSLFSEQQRQEPQNSIARRNSSQRFEQDPPNFSYKRSISPSSQLYQQDPVISTNVPSNSEEYQQFHIPDSWKSFSPDSQVSQGQDSAFGTSVSPDSQPYQKSELHDYALRNNIYLDPQQYREDPRNSATSPETLLYEHNLQNSAARKSFSPGSQPFQQEMQDSTFRRSISPTSRKIMYSNSQQIPMVSAEMISSPDFQQQFSSSRMSISPRRMDVQSWPSNVDGVSPDMEHAFPSSRMSISPREMQARMESEASSSVSSTVARTTSILPRQTEIHQSPSALKSISPSRKSLHPQLQQLQQQESSPRKSVVERGSPFDSQQYQQNIPDSIVRNSISPRGSEFQNLRAQIDMSPEMVQNAYVSPRMSISPRQLQSQQSLVQVLQVPTQQLSSSPSQTATSPGDRQGQRAQQLGRMQSSMKRSLTISPRQSVVPDIASSGLSQSQQASSPRRMQSRVQKSIIIPPEQTQNLHPVSIGKTTSTMNRLTSVSPERMTISPEESIDRSQSVSPRHSVTEQITSPEQIQNQQVVSPQRMQSNASRSMSVSSRQGQMEQLTPPQRMQSTVDMSRSVSPRKTQTQQTISPGENDTTMNRAMSISPKQMQAQKDSLSRIQPSMQRSMSMSPTQISTVEQLTAPQRMQSTVDISRSTSPRKTQTQQTISPGENDTSMNRAMSISPKQTQAQQDSLSRIQPSMQRSMSVSPTQISMEQNQVVRSNSLSSTTATLQGFQPSSPPQLNQYLSATVPRVSVIASMPGTKPMQYARNNTTRATISALPSRRIHVAVDHHLAVTDVVLRSMAALASAVAFCVMVTNTDLINGEIVSYSTIPGFRYVAGTSATAFLIAVLQLGAMVTRKLKSQDITIGVKPSLSWLAFTMIVDQMLAYFLLSAGSVGVGALVYIPSVCKNVAVSHADYCSRSTVSVVLALVTCIVFVMSSILSSFKFFQKTVGSS